MLNRFRWCGVEYQYVVDGGGSSVWCKLLILIAGPRGIVGVILVKDGEGGCDGVSRRNICGCASLLQCKQTCR